MATTETSVNNKASKKGGKGLGPPEERFWKRYSKHHEFPLSTASSVLLHALAFAILIVAWVLFFRGDPDKSKIEIGSVALEEGGSGGLPGGQLGPATGMDEHKEAVKQSPATETVPGQVPPKAELQAPDKNSNQIIKAAEGRERLLPEMEPVSLQFAAASEAMQKVRAVIDAGIARKGQGGPGNGGGPGDGDGTKTGPGTGQGGKMEQRAKRQSRWVMIFNTRNGEDYANQLAGLKATIALPIAGKEGEFEVIEDLKQRPVKLKKKDLKNINQIYWIDDKPESVGSLSRAFGIANAPSYIVAFFPVQLEKELLEKELKYGKAAEDRIEETRFMVRRNRTTGEYEPVVDGQRLK